MTRSTINSRSIEGIDSIDATGTVTAAGLTVDTDTLHIDSTNNNVGIGVSSVVNPSNRTALQVSGGTQGGGIYFGTSTTDTENSRVVSDGSGGVYIATATTGGAPIAFYSGNTERMRIDSSGNVGIGTSSPQAGYKLHVNGAIQAENESFSAGRENASKPSFNFHDDTDTGIFNINPNILGFSTSGSERMRIDASGNVGIGAIPETTFAQKKTLRLSTTASLIAGGAYYPYPYYVANNLYYDSSDNLKYIASSGGALLDVNAHLGGRFSFYTAPTGTSGATASLTERMRIDSSGNVGIGDNNPSQKLSVNGHIKIDAGSTGYLLGPTGEMLVGEDSLGFYLGTGFGINPNIPFYYGNPSPNPTASHNFRGTTFNLNTTNATIALTSNASNVRFDNGLFVIYGSDAGSQLSLWADNSGPTHLAGYTFDIKTGPNNSRTFRGFSQNQTGSVTIGHNAGGPNNGYTTAMDLRYVGGGTEYGIDFLPYANGANALTFWNAAGSVSGAINVGASSTLYNTSSDYRLKTAVTYDWDATSRLKQLKPARFKWIVDGDDAVFVDGFLAHECEAVPEAVTGTKDAMRDEEYEITPAVLDEDDNEVTPAVMGTRSVPDYQGIDQSKLTPLLTKALIEAVEKIEQLEARIAELENV